MINLLQPVGIAHKISSTKLQVNESLYEIIISWITKDSLA